MIIKRLWDAREMALAEKYTIPTRGDAPGIPTVLNHVLVRAENVHTENTKKKNYTYYYYITL